MSDTYTFHAKGRSPRTALTVALIWAGLLALYLWLEASGWIMLFLALFTLPAVADLMRNPDSGLTLSDTALSWHTGRRHAEVALSEIDHVRMDTRLDFSVKVTLVLETGAKVRLPFEATPPHMAFEHALNARDIRTKRFHFQLMQ